MSTIEPAPAKTLGEKLQSLNRLTLYIILIIGATIPAFLPFSVPNEPVPASRDFFRHLNELQEGDTVLIETDWTKSTRGESQGHMENLLRILMRRGVRFAIYSCADPQAPRVARDLIVDIAAEHEKDFGVAYNRWEHWVNLGYYPNSEATNNAIATNVRQAFAGRTDLPGPGRPPTGVFQSPVLENIRDVTDFKKVIIVTASATFNVMVERLSNKLDMLAAVTGVMVPESQVYYDSGQVKGLSGGLKGVYDVETLMEGAWPGKTNKGKGQAYYPTLHIVLGIMMLAIIVGNIGMFLSRRRTAA